MKTFTILKTNILLLVIATIFSCSKQKKIKPTLEKKNKDSVDLWIKKATNKKFKNQEQKIFLNKAYERITSRIDNKIKARKLSVIAYRYRELNDSLLFHNINKEAQKLAYRLKDTFTIADTHWSLANYYNGLEVYDKSYYHYNTAYNLFDKINKDFLKARMLYSMAFIKGRYKDYNGSEVLNIKAIEIFKKLKKNKFLYYSYNHLASLQNDIQKHDKALFYYEIALEFYEKVKNKQRYYQATLNNIGNTHLKKKNFNKALEYYNKELNNNLNINHFARVIDNKAYCKLQLNDSTSVKRDMLRALFIRDSLKNKAGIVASKIHLSEYYKYIKDTLTAINYSKEASDLALKIKNGGEYLRTLQQLADLEPKKSKQYLERYIQFNDSLITTERKAQEKFTKIAFETDEYIEETKRLSQQTIIISITSIGLILILALAYFLRVQKSKNEKLALEYEQQEANEQVYLLTLKQQAIIEEERVQERNRISEELHDGVLGRLFGTRVGLGFLDLESSKETQEQHEAFLEELQEIEKEIRDVSHKLNTNFNSDQVNFTTLIEQLLKTTSTTGNFEYKVAFAEAISWKNISQVIKVNVYRIVQESLQNIVKYAKAKNVILDFSFEEGKLELHIQDDGVGFDIKKAKKGIGIKNMKSRVQKLHGTMQISSEVKKGTSIAIKIPVIEA